MKTVTLLPNACSGTLPEIQPGGVPERACGPDVCDMASFVRESVANDDSDDNDHITLSLGCLDTESDNALDLDLVREVAPYFRLKEKETNAIINIIQQNVAQWEQLATDLGIPRNEME